MTRRVSNRRLVGWACSALAVLLGVSCGLAQATPTIPARDDAVLEEVPAAGESKALEPLRTELQRHPDDLQSALALARGYLSIGRANADPRFVSYAQATLTPWMAQGRANAAVLTLQATTLQYLHQFDAALSLLDKAIALSPLDGQAHLTKAAILQVQGRLDAARQACRPLIRTSGQLIALTCLTGVNSLNGQLASSYAALNGAFRDDARLSTEVRVWIFDQLADMAVRLGDHRAAAEDLSRALRASPSDAFTQAAYADLLLSEHREGEVIELLRGTEQQDNLLLRLAIAGSRLHDSKAAGWSDSYQERYQAARRDGDFTHLREQARFVLEVRHDPIAAADLARRNWQVQREPADVRVYVEAAVAAGDRSLAQPVWDWMAQTHYEDASL